MKIFAQVVFRHGVIRSVVADGEMTVAEFMDRVRGFGAVKLIRELRDARPGDDAIDVATLPNRRS